MNKKQYDIIMAGLSHGREWVHDQGIDTTRCDKAIATLESLPGGDSAWVVGDPNFKSPREFIGMGKIWPTEEKAKESRDYGAAMFPSLDGDYEVREITIQFVEK